ncbi:MAG: ABC transporter permease [Treponema sp.]|nr:ABC transporter permease [Treponema sp.]
MDRKKNLRWICFVAARYLFRKQRRPPSVVLSVLGIATGVLALIVIISVMNGFQLGFIESILEISSYHMRVGSVPEERTGEAREALLAIPGIDAVVPFREFQGIVRGRMLGQQAALVRGVPEDAPAMDPAMAERLDFEWGSFDLYESHSALIGAELARRLGVRAGGRITLFSIPSLFAVGDAAVDEGEIPGSQVFTVTGVFRTGFFDYDMGWIFVRFEDARAFSDGDPVLGVKIANRFHDRRMLERARESLGRFENADFSSWRDYNRAFFGALRTEKLFMFILVGLIFIVVALNIYQAQRRILLERREEIGLLRALGGGERAVRLIFVLDGAIIGLSGAVLGLVPGLLIALNISGFFSGLEAVVNTVIDILNAVAVLFGGGAIGDFAVFSPRYFYLTEITSRVIPGEVVLIFSFGFLSSLAAAWFASRKVSRIQPAEVLRYE